MLETVKWKFIYCQITYLVFNSEWQKHQVHAKERPRERGEQKQGNMGPELGTLGDGRADAPIKEAETQERDQVTRDEGNRDKEDE